TGAGAGRQRFDRARPVEPDISVELPWQLDACIVALQFRFGPVDHTDKALQPLHGQTFAQLAADIGLHQDAAADPAIVELPFDAFGPRRPYLHHLHWLTPVVRSRHRPGVRAEADRGDLVAEALPAELAQIELVAHPPHVGEPGIADVGIVCP